MRGADTNAGGALPYSWLPALGTPQAGGERRSRAIFLHELRAAHRSEAALASAAEAWMRMTQPGPLAQAFGLLREEAEEGVRRIEYILSCLGHGTQGAAPWIGQDDLVVPGSAGDAGLVSLARWALGRMACRMLDLRALAHDCAEYQAARLLEMSAEEMLTTARQIAAIGRVPEATGTAAPEHREWKTQ
ncbi:hypothetical protein [Roseomonas xinghualingensis]|uniref:hypothetical protein n=1 Tax=Roseomonas xinghualingensis TaxID=2986475 RepID=UPI0021F13EF8|nr:hypothetical protein [Roseomonas sp. SXEYE001]MCV4208545.1 hypothetical protein [Roseomonas sp. SXEYE001]